MSDKDKWKTFPCKECLLKAKCSKQCFSWPKGNWPIDGIVEQEELMFRHIKENQLENICLRCGAKDANTFIDAITKEMLATAKEYDVVGERRFASGFKAVAI